MLIFGLGYSAGVLAARLRRLGWAVYATGRDGDLDFADRAAVEAALAGASHVLSSVPPVPAEGDPVLAAYREALENCGAWVGYLSSTGVYGDTGGAWSMKLPQLDKAGAPRGPKRTLRGRRYRIRESSACPASTVRGAARSTG